MIQKMSSTLGTFVLNIGEQCTQYCGQLSLTFSTFFQTGISTVCLLVRMPFITVIVIFLIILQMLLYVYEYVRARELLIIYDMMSAEEQRLIQSTITRRSNHMDKTNKVRH